MHLLDWRIATRRAAIVWDGVRGGMMGIAPQHYFDAFARSIGESDARCAEHILRLEAARSRSQRYPRVAEDT